MLVDLHTALPDWTPAVMRTTVTGFFLAWFLRPAPARSWMQRPPAWKKQSRDAVKIELFPDALKGITGPDSTPPAADGPPVLSVPR